MSKEKVRVDPETGAVLNLLTEDGAEIPDPVPMAPPVGFKRQQPLHERIRAMVQHEYLRARESGEYESPEEADDFIIPGEDNMDPREERFALMPGHEYEENYEPPATFKEMKDRLVAAGWTPPPAKADRTPLEGGETPTPGKPIAGEAPKGAAPAKVDPGPEAPSK